MRNLQIEDAIKALDAIHGCLSSHPKTDHPIFEEWANLRHLLLEIKDSEDWAATHAMRRTLLRTDEGGGTAVGGHEPRGKS